MASFTNKAGTVDGFKIKFVNKYISLLEERNLHIRGSKSLLQVLLLVNYTVSIVAGVF